MAESFLILYPGNSAWSPIDIDGIVNALKTIGFLGKARQDGAYEAGEHYLSLVTYLGCSPQIMLGDCDGATSIRIEGFAETRCLHGTNSKPPRCPRCRRTLAAIEPCQEWDRLIRCENCGYEARAQALDWRRTAAFGKVFIEISNVFESEAVPGDDLTGCLQQATGEAWDYAYVSKQD